jgi:arginyl-tRNA synthetase
MTEELFKEALKEIGAETEHSIEFETPKNEDHGDLSTNIAMKLAKELKNSPRNIAQNIIDKIQIDDKIIEKIEIAGPGFINIKFKPEYYHQNLDEIISKGQDHGRSSIGNNIKVNVEYVSANPTGLLHIGHGRNACIGDSVANLYDWLGYDVTREYYFNNAGNQMNNLAKSIFARYQQKYLDNNYPFPEDGYYGEYIKIIADNVFTEKGDTLKEENKENLNICAKFGEEWCFGKISETLQKLNIKQDVYYNEDTLYKEGKIDDVINELKKQDLAYEKDGALWFRLTKLGMEDDRVIVKSTGEPTYRLPDIAYHREKFKRGFDIIIDVFGADHIATVPDVMAGVKALGYDPEKIKVLIHQFVTLMEKGSQVKMSKRTGKGYTLDDLIDDVGSEVARFFFIMRSFSTHLEFDLDLAREQSEKNPVFYLQYAHARVSSILDKLKEEGIVIKENASLNQLKEKAEIDLIKQLMKFEKSIVNAAEKFEPQIISEYLKELASKFHSFYHECRIIGVQEELMQARIKLATATKITLKNGLSILGISAPEKM